MRSFNVTLLTFLSVGALLLAGARHGLAEDSPMARADAFANKPSAGNPFAASGLRRRRKPAWMQMLGRTILLLLVCACAPACQSITSRYADGVDRLESGDYPEAIRAFTAVIEQDPRGDLAYLARGDTYLALGKAELAVEDYTRGLELLQSAPIPWFYTRRGFAHLCLNDLRGAEADWKLAMELEQRRRDKGYKMRSSPGYVEVLQLRARLLAEIGGGSPEPRAGRPKRRVEGYAGERCPICQNDVPPAPSLCPICRRTPGAAALPMR
ncbi:tetratricopeptide repeat protein [Planctomycetota bacterium]